MRTPIFLTLIALFLILPTAGASSFLGKAPESGIVISVNPEKIPSKSGETVLIKGTIKYVKKPNSDKSSNGNNGDDKRAGLLEEFKSQGIEITGSYPSSVVDISSYLNLKSKSDSEIEFSYLTKSLVTDDLNQFSVKVFNNHTNKGTLKRLSIIQAKLYRRVQLLTKLMQKHEGLNSSLKAVAVIEKEIAKLNAIITKISSKANADESLIAENTYALQVDNSMASESAISTVMNNFRFKAEATPGSAIQGSKVSFKSQIVNLLQANTDADSSEDINGYLAEFQFNNQIISSQKILKDRKNVNVVFGYVTAPLNPSNSNIFSVALYHLDDAGQKGRRIGYIDQKLPVIADTAKPLILSGAVPNDQDRYSQQLRLVNIKANDSFGQINPTSFKLFANKEGTISDLSSLIASNKIDDSTYEFTGDLNPLDEGEYTLTVKVSDEAGNQADSYSVTVQIDRTAPIIHSTLTDNTLTNQNSIEVPITVSDLSPTATNVFVNNDLVLTTPLKMFSVSATLSFEGNNTIRIETKDAAGNIAAVKEIVAVRDTTPPELSNILPQNNSIINTIQFIVSAQANEKLKYVKVNGTPSPLAADKFSFGMTYIAQDDGELDINIECADQAGNIAHNSTSVFIKNRLLNVDLIHVGSSFNGQRLMVTGLEEATRAGSRVEISSGFLGLNSGETISNGSNGSFTIEMDYFTQAIIIVTDTASGETERATLIFDKTKTKLSGIIKDSNNNPLPNVTVKITGSVSSYLTDGAGMFAINNPPTGDQTLLVDGSTVPQSITGPTRRFFSTKISINVGIGQNNVMDNPIYLTPLYLDGTQTEINTAAGGIVTSSHAPGVELKIPANTVVFPDGGSNGAINVVRIISEYSTIAVPKFAIPTYVYSFEPSGLSFKQRVELILPNDNELPAGVEFLIYSMDSSTGKWEIDGSAQVSQDGQSVITKPGLGISHFSTIYAVPLSPLIHEVKNPKLSGVDVSEGSLERKIELPSYKSLGNKITPSLTYKSAWAAPTALVANILDIPEMRTDLSGAFYGAKYEFKSYSKQYCWRDENKARHCEFRPAQYLLGTESSFEGNIKSWYEPEEIKSQFFINGISTNSDDVFFEEPKSDEEILGDSRFKNVISSKISVVSKRQETQIPRKSQISYAIELYNSETGEYLNSGIYPSLSRYQIKLKNMLMLTGTNVTRITVNGKKVATIRSIYDNKIETQLLDQAIPKDILSTILVQSKIKSNYGRGWNLNGVQKILNTNGGRVLLESEDGSPSTYVLNNTMSTVFNANGTEYDLTNAVDLSTWPEIHLQRTTSSTNSIARISISSTGSSVNVIGQIDKYSGIIGSEGLDQCRAQLPVPPPKTYDTIYGTQTIDCTNDLYANCGSTYEQLTKPTYKPVDYKYSVKPNLSGVVRLGNDLYGIDAKNHMLFKLNQNGSISKLAGYRSTVHDYIRTNTGMWRLDMNNSQIGEFCKNTFGKECSFLQYESQYTTKCAPVPASELSFGVLKNGRWIYATGIWNFCPTTAQLNSAGYMGAEPGSALSLCVSFGGRNGYPAPYQFPLATFSGDIGVKGFSGQETQSGIATNPDSIGLNNPKGILVDSEGNIIFVDSGNNRVRKVNLVNNTVQTIVGNGEITDNGDGGLATSASIYHPKELAMDGLGQLYISSENGYIRKVDANGIISTFAGRPIDQGGVLGDNIHAEQMALNNPSGMVIDKDNAYLYVADTGNHRVIRIDLNTRAATTVAGTGTCDARGLGNNTPALSASLCSPTYVGLDADKNLIVVDPGHAMIRRVVFQSGSSELTYLPSNKDLSVLTKKIDGTWTRKYRNGSVARFNADGNQTNGTDRSGRSISFEYSNGLLTKIINNVTTQTTELSYDANQKLVSLKDPADRTTTFSYSDNKLNSVTFPDNSTKRFVYNDKGLMTSEYDALNAETKFEYNSYNRPKKIINPNLSETKLFDQESAAVISNTGDGELRSYGSGDGQINSQVFDPSGAKTEYVKDFNGLLTEVTDASGAVTKVYRDLDGNILKTIDPEDKEFQYTYDQSTGDLIHIVNVENQITTSVAYNTFGFPVSSTDARGFVTYMDYDSVTGYLLKERSSLPDTEVNYTYNTQGLVAQKTRKKGSQSFSTHFVYDLRGNISEVTDPENKKFANTYDHAGNLIKSTVQINGSTTSEVNYEYDSMGRLMKVISPKNEITLYSYYPTGQIHTITDPKNKVTTFSYNNMGQLIHKQKSTGEIYTFKYDPQGKWVHEIDPNGNIKKYEYNILNKLSKVELPDDVITYTYNTNGEIKTAANKNSKIIYTIDSLKRVTNEYFTGQGDFANLTPLSILYEYDQNSNKVRTTLNNSLVYNYSYDALNRLTQITNPFGDVFNYEYDTLNRITKLTRPNGETNYSYTNNHFVSEIQHKLKGMVKSQFQYEYDLRNFITQKRSLTSTENYSYDLNGQLTNTQGVNIDAESFSYDSIGNRLTDVGGNYTYDSSTERLTEDYKYIYLYDNNGNLIAKNPKNQAEKAYRYEYTSTNQLKSVITLSNPFGSSIHQVKFDYDVRGRRMRKEITDPITPGNNSFTLYQYDADNVVLESKAQTGSYGVVAAYTHSLAIDDVLAVNIPSLGVTNKKAKQSGNYYFLKDHLGSIVAVADGDGNIKQQYRYSSYGKILKVDDAAGTDIASDQFIDNQYTFTGREYDSEINTYYYRARYYDANIGRFLQQDPHPGDLSSPITVINRYTYTANNPVMYNDPSGRIFGVDDLTFIIISTIVLGSIDNNINGGSYLDSLIKGFALTMILYGTYQMSPSMNPFGIFEQGSQLLAFSFNIGGLAYTSGTQSGNSFNNFVKQTFNGDTIKTTVFQWMAYGADKTLLPDMLSSDGGTRILAGSLYLFVTFISYLSPIDSFCNPREANGDPMLDGAGREEHLCR